MCFRETDVAKGRSHLLLVVKCPRYLVVVTGAEIDHDVLVSEEEHHRAGVIELVHIVEVGHLSSFFREVQRSIIRVGGARCVNFSLVPI